MRILTTSIITKLAVGVLICLTLLPSIGHVLGNQGELSRAENRYLAEFPVKAETFVGFTSQMDRYLNDHFGLRSIAIRAERRLRRLWGDGETSVYFGREGWMYWSESRIWESWKGRARFSQTDIDDFQAALDGLDQEVRAADAIFAFLVPPDKATIYPEFVPARFGGKSSRNFYDYFFSENAQPADYALDVRSRLSTARQSGPVYFKTDTHWTRRGAFQAFELIMDYATKQGLQLSEIQNGVVETSVEYRIEGELAKLTSRPEPEILKDMKVTLKTPHACRVLNEDVEHAEHQTRICERAKGTGPTIVIVGDSFASYILDYFKINFDRVIFVHHRMGAFDRAEIFKYDPDLVVFMPVERFLLELSDFYPEN